MALTKFTQDIEVISKLDDEPNDVGGLSPAELKSKYDEAGGLIKTYINDILTAEQDAFNSRTDNPHAVTKEQVGLGAADNTADADKPISGPQQTALNQKADKTNVLEKDNSTAFTPTGDYQPSTKKYVDQTVGAVVLGQIPDKSISTEKLADGAVESMNLSQGAVSTEKMANGAVTESKLENGAVSTIKIAPSAVTVDKLAESVIPDLRGALHGRQSKTTYELFMREEFDKTWA